MLCAYNACLMNGIILEDLNILRAIIQESKNVLFSSRYLKNTNSYANRVTIQAGFQKAIDDGVFTEAQCINRYHFITKVPSSELDIPLDKFFKPKRNNYIYHYLIQCYRTKKPEHTLIINQSAMKIKTMRQQIVQSQNFIRQCEKSIIETEKKLQDEQKKYLKNDIFAGYQINTYKSPARMKLKQQEELKPKKKQKKDTEIKKQ